jgi:molybdopterin-dependent oxidoreductase alpha subunit
MLNYSVDAWFPEGSKKRLSSFGHFATKPAGFLHDDKEAAVAAIDGTSTSPAGSLIVSCAQANLNIWGDFMSKDETVHYNGPAGGWGSVRGISRIFAKELSSPAVAETLRRQNKPGGFMCVSCAWTKPADYHPLEFCENGAKATLWELTTRRCTPDFFAKHTVSELRQWKDHDLEQEGRLTHPMWYDRESDRYVPCSWDEAFTAIGQELKSLDPRSVILYTSGRASLETSYLYALFARLYGSNNLPDSSNMCHETTPVGLKKVIGASVGTSIFQDFSTCDAIFFFGQNTGSNSPRFLHPLQAAVKRGCKIVTFNPVREKGLETMINPQSPTEMLTGKETQISCQYHQVKAGGDIAALMGMCKHVFAKDDEAKMEGRAVIDRDFIAQHTNGFNSFEQKVRDTSWEQIERESGLARAALEDAGQVYVDAERVIGIYGMGLTQQVGGFDSIAMLVNLLLLKGNIGRDGTGNLSRSRPTPTCRDNGRWAFPKSRSSSLSTSSPRCSTSSLLVKRA